MTKSYDSSYLKWKSWGEKYQFGDLSPKQHAYYKAEIKRSCASLPKSSKVLEVGFGSGSFLSYAKRKKWDICGTEVNKHLVEAGTRSGFNVILSKNLKPFSDNIFDLVVAFDVLEHIHKEDLIQFFAEIKRVLKPGGVFIACFPNGDSPLGLRHQNGDITHVTAIGSEMARYLATQSELKIVFLGGQAEPLLVGDPVLFVHRLLTLPIIKTLNFFTNVLITPRSWFAFYSSNLTLSLKNK